MTALTSTIARLPGADAAPAGPAPASARIDWVVVAAVAVLGVAGAAYLKLGVVDRIADLEAALQSRPPLAVIDYASIQEALAAGASPADIQPAFAAVKGRAAALKEQGYLVINRAAVETAPDQLMLPAAPVYLAPRAAAAPAFPPPPAPPAAGLAAARDAPSPRGAMTDAEAAAMLRALTEPGAVR